MNENSHLLQTDIKVLDENASNFNVKIWTQLLCTV